MNILFGAIDVKIGKEVKHIKDAVYTENATEYRGIGRKFKDKAIIVKKYNSKVIGKTNY